MKTATGMSAKTKYGARIVASILLAGGLLGLVGSVFAVHHSAQQHQVLASVSGVISTALFACCIPTGIALWRTTPNGIKSAKLLFALQLPVFSIARFSYEFSTFFSFRVMVGNTTRHVGGDIGSSLNLNWLPQSVGFLFGINIAAILILLFLIQASRVRSQEVSRPAQSRRGIAMQRPA